MLVATRTPGSSISKLFLSYSLWLYAYAKTIFHKSLDNVPLFGGRRSGELTGVGCPSAILDVRGVVGEVGGDPLVNLFARRNTITLVVACGNCQPGTVPTNTQYCMA